MDQGLIGMLIVKRFLSAHICVNPRPIFSRIIAAVLIHSQTKDQTVRAASIILNRR